MLYFHVITKQPKIKQKSKQEIFNRLQDEDISGLSWLSSKFEKLCGKSQLSVWMEFAVVIVIPEQITWLQIVLIGFPRKESQLKGTAMKPHRTFPSGLPPRSQFITRNYVRLFTTTQVSGICLLVLLPPTFAHNL